MARLRPPGGVGRGVEDPDIDHGEETRGGSGSKVKTDAMFQCSL